MSVLKRKEIPVALFAVFGLTVLFAYFSGVKELESISSSLITWPVTLAMFAIILGIAGFVGYHARIVSKRLGGWPYSLEALLAFVITLAAGFVFKPLYDYIVTNIVVTLTVAVTCFVAFYNYTLFFRATRVRTVWVAILIVVSIMFILWMVPVGAMIFGPGFTAVVDWIYAYPNAGGMKALLIVVAVGIILLFIRGCLGYEKSQIGGE